MAYPTSVTTFTTKNDGDVIATSHVNGLQTEVTAIETQLLLGWTAYVPVWTGASVNPAIGDGTIVGAYHQVGKLVKARIAINMGSTTTYGTGAWSITLPFTADATAGYVVGSALMSDTGGTGFHVGVATIATTATISLLAHGASAAAAPAVPFAWAATDVLIVDVEFVKA